MYSSLNVATASSSTMSTSWVAPIATPAIHVSGHQRAALELRNLTLEREASIQDYVSIELRDLPRNVSTSRPARTVYHQLAEVGILHGDHFVFTV